MTISHSFENLRLVLNLILTCKLQECQTYMLWDTKEGKLWGLTKQWQRTCKKKFKYTKMFKVNKIHDIRNFMNFCPMECSYDSKTLLAISHDFKFKCWFHDINKESQGSSSSFLFILVLILVKVNMDMNQLVKKLV